MSEQVLQMDSERPHKPFSAWVSENLIAILGVTAVSVGAVITLQVQSADATAKYATLESMYKQLEGEVDLIKERQSDQKETISVLKQEFRGYSELSKYQQTQLDNSIKSLQATTKEIQDSLSKLSNDIGTVKAAIGRDYRLQPRTK